MEDAGVERAVVIGSLSKSFMCGLRVGWLISSPDRIQSIVSLKRAMEITGPPFMQGIALSALRTGEYDAHLIKARQHYQERRDATLEALETFMPEGITWTLPQGGFHLWVTLPTGYSSIALFLLAVERGIAFSPGPLHDLDHRFINAFRLSYGSTSADRIRQRIEQLGEAVRELLKQPPSDAGLSGLGNY